MGVRHEVWRVARATWREVRDENITFMAGSIAYFAFVSLLPLLLFALFVLSAIDNRALTAYLYSLTESVLTPYARELLVDSLDSTSAQAGVSVIGGITLLWGISRVFRGLDVAFVEIYGVKENKGILIRLVDGFVVALALVAAIAAVVLGGVAFALVPDLPYPAVVNPLLLVVGLSVAFFPIYYVFPDVDVRAIEVIPGTVIAAVGWTVLEVAFQGYVAYAGRYEAAYGTLGSALLLLIWLYFSGLVLLVGGVVNAVLAGRTRDENALGTPENFEIDDSEGSRTDVGINIARETRREFGSGPRISDRRDSSGGRSEPTGSSETTGRSDETVEQTAAEVDADYRQLHEEIERLTSEVERVEAENERLRHERARLKRNNADLARRLERRRRSQSLWGRVKQRVFQK